MSISLPHSIDAEQSVIGGLMLDNHAWERIGEILQPEDFYHAAHREVFCVIKDFASKNISYDILVVKEKLKTIQKLSEIGGEAFLFELVHNTPSTANIQAYASIVRNKGILRRLIQVTKEIQEEINSYRGNEAAEILSNAEKMIFDLGKYFEKIDSPKPISEALKKSIEKMDKLSQTISLSGIGTGYKKLDQLTHGLQRGDLIILAARPSMGKTSLAMNIAENVSKSGKGVIVFSMEMSSISIANRLLSSDGKITQNKIKSGKLDESEYSRIGDTIKRFSDSNMFIDDSSSLTYSEILSRSRRLHRKFDIGLIIVDYIQLMRCEGKLQNRNIEMSEISRGLKLVAKELDVPVIALSQLNRDLERRQEKRPTVSDLRDSGAIEQDADMIIFIYRDEIYNKESSDLGIAEIIVSKHRNGELDNFPLLFCGKYTRFENPMDKF